MTRRGGVLVAIAFSILLVSSTATATGPGLVAHMSRLGQFSLQLPATWHYKNATYPSDHTTELWTDPGNRMSKLEINVSGCVGCVEPPSCTIHGTGCRANPAGLVPKGTTSTRKISPWRVQFEARTASSPYLEDGLIVVRHNHNTIVDWAYVQLWLPTSQQRLANRILASFTFN